jgi:hypothetical protein
VTIELAQLTSRAWARSQRLVGVSELPAGLRSGSPGSTN